MFVFALLRFAAAMIFGLFAAAYWYVFDDWLAMATGAPVVGNVPFYVVYFAACFASSMMTTKVINADDA